MANPDFLDVLGEEMGRVYEACHDRLLINLARHFKYLKPGEEPGGAFEYQARKLLEMGQLTRESVEIIKTMLDGADPALADCLEAAIVEALEDVEPELRKAVEAGLLGEEMPPEISPRATAAFERYYEQSADKLNLVNTVMLESTENAYRKTVADITARMQRAQTIVDAATGEVVTGVESFNQALKDAVRKLVATGITGFVDHSGRRWRPETYVAMDMRTTFHNVSREAFWERNEEYGNDQYLVSQHPGARPLCYPWQCKVISRTDQARDVTDGANQPVHVYAQSETTYGEPAGLFGINCGHHPMLFIPGATKIPELMQNEQENAETYAQSQKQRKLERDFRKARLEYESAKAQGADEQEVKAAQEKLKRADERLDRFEKETGRRRRREREYGPVQAKGPTSSELTRKVEEAAKGGRHPESAQKAPESVQKPQESAQKPQESAQKPAESDRRPPESAPESAQDIAETRKSVTEEQAPVEKPLTDEAKDDKIEAQGFNWNDASFYTETKFARHADRHMVEFGYLSREEYLDGARKLLSSDISEAVEGFTGKDGFVFRYDVESNALAIGHPGGSISTYFKPAEGREYWNDQIRKYKP